MYSYFHILIIYILFYTVYSTTKQIYFLDHVTEEQRKWINHLPSRVFMLIPIQQKKLPKATYQFSLSLNELKAAAFI